MATTGFGYGNLFDAAALSGAGWSTTYPLANMQERELATYASTTGTSAEIIMSHGSAVAAQVFCLFAHSNVDATATIQVTRGTTSGASDVYDSGVLSCWPFVPLGGILDGSHFGLFVVAWAPSTAAYTKIEVLGGSTPMHFGRAFVGPLFLPTHNPAYGHTDDGWQAANSTVRRTQSGADWAAQRTELRSAPFDLAALPPDEASLYHEIQRTHTVTGEVVYVRDTQDRAAQQQYGFLGTLNKLTALTNPFYGHCATAVAIDERGGAP